MPKLFTVLIFVTGFSLGIVASSWFVADAILSYYINHLISEMP